MQKNQSKLAHFGIQQGYALNGDFALLSAELALPTPSAGWSLQLWACDAPAATGELDGVMVAEAPVDAAAIDAEGRGMISQQVPAKLPVRGRDYAMVMALARRDANGLAQIHAVSNFNQRQWVEGPCLQGGVGYAIQGEAVQLSVDAVYNPRLDNVSGTLALELWAFSKPYDGRPQKDGHHVAGLELSCLPAQTAHQNIVGTTPFCAPQSGRWHMALLLREWTASGYVTRDFRTFDVAYERLLPAEPVAPVAKEEAAPVAVAPVAAAKPVAATPIAAVKPVAAAPVAVKPVAPAPAPTLKPIVVAPVAAAPVAAVKPVAAASVAAVSVAAAKPVAAAPVAAAPVAAAPVAAAPVAAAPVAAVKHVEPVAPEAVVAASTVDASSQADDVRVCIQTATADELARVPGLNKKLAQEIIRARPFKSLDGLTSIRGIGDKTLRKLRGLLKA